MENSTRKYNIYDRETVEETLKYHFKRLDTETIADLMGLEVDDVTYIIKKYQEQFSFGNELINFNERKKMTKEHQNFLVDYTRKNIHEPLSMIKKEFFDNLGISFHKSTIHNHLPPFIFSFKQLSRTESLYPGYRIEYDTDFHDLLQEIQNVKIEKVFFFYEEAYEIINRRKTSDTSRRSDQHKNIKNEIIIVSCIISSEGLVLCEISDHYNHKQNFQTILGIFFEKVKNKFPKECLLIINEEDKPTKTWMKEIFENTREETFHKMGFSFYRWELNNFSKNFYSFIKNQVDTLDATVEIDLKQFIRNEAKNFVDDNNKENIINFFAHHYSGIN